MRDYSLESQKTNTRGRKKRVGSLMRLSNGSLGVFAGYCENPSCSSKICMDIDSATYFSRLYSKNRKKLINRIILALLNKLELQTR